MGKKSKEVQEQPLVVLLAPVNEVIALGAAVTTYQLQVARFFAKSKEHQKIAGLLESFQRRLVQQIGHGPPDPLELELQKFLAKRKL